MQAKSSSNISSLGNSFTVLCRYLQMTDKIRLAQVSKHIRKIMLNGQVWGTFDIVDYQMRHAWQQFLTWASVHLGVIQPYALNISIRQQANKKQLLTIFQTSLPSIRELSIDCESESVHIAVSICCPNIEKIIVGSTIFSDELFTVMLNNLKNVNFFEVRKDDSNFTAKTFNRDFVQRLKTLILKPHLLTFEKLGNLLAESKILQKLELDVEECDERILVQIIQNLPQIENLRLFHMENIYSDEKLSAIMSPKITGLTLTKTYHLPLTKIVEVVASVNLLNIEFTEAPHLRDCDVWLIAERAVHLKKINLSWCNGVTCSGVQQIVLKCLQLEDLIVIGLKDLNDSAFTEYSNLKPFFNEAYYDHTKNRLCEKQEVDDCMDKMFNTDVKNKLKSLVTLRKLKKLECMSCNSVSDLLLKVVACVARKARVVNYYSDEIQLAYARD